MNVKKSLGNRIRGWLPNTPKLPQYQTPQLKITPTKNLANPLPPVLEIKFQRSVGIFIGFGVGLMVLGFGAALMTNLTYNDVARFFDSATDNYIFRDMLDRISFYLALGVGGIFFAVLGALSLKSSLFRKPFQSREKNFWGNFMFGLGVGAMVISFRPLFLYLLAPTDPVLNHGYIQLWVFALLLIAGAILFTGVLLSWKTKK